MNSNRANVLYFNEDTKVFSKNPDESSAKIFETWQRDERLFRKEEFEYGPFRINICANFNPSYHKSEYIYVDIYVNGVLLLPLSIACRKADVLYHFGEREITFQQWGSGNNAGKSPHTLMQTMDDINWGFFLDQICDICNNYQEWIVDEIQTLIQMLTDKHLYKPWNIAIFLDLVRRYDSIVPSIIPVYRKFVDIHCFKTMSGLFELMEKLHLSWNENTRLLYYNYVNTLWSYINDFYFEEIGNSSKKD